MVRVYVAKSIISPKTHMQQSQQAHRLLELALRRDYPEVRVPVLVEKDVHGKPYLPEYPEICVNLSHSGGYAACAIGEKPVGVDVEVWKSRKKWQRIVEKFHPQERELLRSLREEDQEEVFYRIWVRKESFVKAVGRGLVIPLDSFSCREDSGRVWQHWDGKAYYCRSYPMTGEGCSLAVCSEETEFAESPVWLSPDEVSP